MTDSAKSITIALAKLSVGITWCLAWGEQRQPQFELAVLQQMRQALNEGREVPEEVRRALPLPLASLVQQVQQLQAIPKDYFPNKITELRDKYPELWQQVTRIGLVYGKATKIKGYVFEAAKLQDIRGASALLDRINLIDLPAFFSKDPEDSRYQQQCQEARNWLDECSSKDTDNLKISDALIPELIIYSTGGNILAFCPAAYIHDLANAIEKRYTEETLTANSCAVGDTFRLLEIRFGLLQNPIENTLWLDWYLHEQKRSHPLVDAYFGRPEAGQDWQDLFKNRKHFNELAGKLAASYNKRRNGNEPSDRERPTRRYAPIFETHPYLQRDEGERRSAVFHATKLPGEPWFSETLARKRLMGEITKREVPEGLLPEWYREAKFEWEPGEVKSWVRKFELFLLRSERWRKYYAGFANSGIKEARSITEIGNGSSGFVGYIYADCNNMGGYIQKYIKTPGEYKKFSEDVFKATEESVYEALHQHLNPHPLEGLTGEEHQKRNGVVIHPFEILTIGGDDVLLVVPANKALAIAKTLGEEFERILVNTGHYQLIPSSKDAHRYQGEAPATSYCELSMSIGVLITAYNTPIYYAKNIYEQLLKSAKKQANILKYDHHYQGGTMDFLTMKSVTMISSNLENFRKEGLTRQKKGQPQLKLYAAPYTLHELGGLLKTAEALKESKFPRSQLYQIRSLLEQGKHTAILNYRYFRVRLQPDQQKLLAEWFEKAWCQAKTNDGNLAPWMSILPKSASPKQPEQKPKKQNQQPSHPSSQETSSYETIWRELVELYPFIDESVTQLEKEVSQ
jgi:CRISPR-associated protein Cmr2